MLQASIISFLNKHHLLTLATSCDNIPYCASCFYAFKEDEALLIIASETKTRHIQEALKNSTIAGTIALETNIIGKIQGAQFIGTFRSIKEDEKKIYFKRFPYAIAMKPLLWAIEIEYLKFTDNTLGFGKKLEFHRSNFLP